MHSRTRRKTKKRPARPLPARATAQVTPVAVPEVNDEELSKLADDLAYFNAEHYREVKPGDVREADVRRAKSEIAALFKRKGRK
jgi:hypothetical protein